MILKICWFICFRSGLFQSAGAVNVSRLPAIEYPVGLNHVAKIMKFTLHNVCKSENLQYLTPLNLLPVAFLF